MLREILRVREQPFTDLARLARERMIEKIERGSKTLSETRFLHTEPHHDDLMLGYLPWIVRHMRDPSNDHYFGDSDQRFHGCHESLYARAIAWLAAVDWFAGICRTAGRELL
jgi:hypothetical protein